MKKKYIIYLIITSFLAFISITTLSSIVDPLGINTKQEYYLKDASYARYQNIGIAHNNQHETIITGTSLSENFKTSLSNEVFDTKTIKIPMSGASAKEQSILISNAISENTKRIIWDIHYTAYHGDKNRMHKSHEFPLYLYDKSSLNDLKLYGSFDILKLSLKKAVFRDKYYTNNMDELYNWYQNDKNKFGEKQVLKYIDRLKVIINNSKVNKEYNFDNLKNNFDGNILPIIKENPNIEFDFYFPPYMVNYFMGFNRSNLLNDIIKFKQYFLEKSFEYSNMNIHDFSVDYETIEDLKNYKDTHHFSQNISDKILQDIRSNSFLVNKDYTAKNINNYKKYIIKELENNR